MSLRVWLPLNKDLRNQGLSGSLSFTNTSATLNSSGYYDFSGYTGYGINVGGNIWNTECTDFYNTYINNHSFSLSCWIKLSGNGAAPIICLGYGVGMRVGNSGKPFIWLTGDNGNGGTVNGGVTASVSIGDGKWHHIASTYNVLDNAIKIYIDGVCKGTAYYPTGYKFIMKWYNTICIGRNPNDSQQTNVYFLQGSIYDVRIYNHALSNKEVTELARGCILHYPMNDTLNESTVNLVSSITAGGRTTVSNGVVTTSGVNADTYFTLNLSESIVSGTQYTISCEADMLSGTYWDFPLGSQGNTELTWRLKPGYNAYTFTANNISWGAQRIFVDDTGGTARTSGYQCKFWNFQLEKKDHATPYTPTSRTSTIIRDNSGFGNDATIIKGELQIKQLMPNTGRYDKCVYFDGNTYTRTINLPSDRIRSYSFWIYLQSYVDRAIVFIGDPVSKICFSFWSSNYLILGTDTVAVPGARFDRNIIPLGQWVFIAANYKGDNHNDIELYVNSTKYTSTVAEWYTNSAQNILNIGGRNDGGVSYNGVISDLRIYTTILSEDTIKDLYQTGFAIDKSQNGYCYELIESNTQSSVDVKKNGQLVCKNYFEACPDTYDSNIYTEPDGSQWLRIFHHNNPANALFSSGDTFTTGVYKDADRWFKVSLCNNVSKWELMVKQKLTSTSDQAKYRWIQNVNPLTAVFGDVDAADITKYTSSQGYADMTSYMGGIYKKNNNAYIIQNDSNSGNWFGAIGSWSSYNRGIPSCGSRSVITDGYVDLYLRIDNLDKNELSSLFIEGEQIARLGKTGVTMNEINEI